MTNVSLNAAVSCLPFIGPIFHEYTRKDLIPDDRSAFSFIRGIILETSTWGDAEFVYNGSLTPTALLWEKEKIPDEKIVQVIHTASIDAEKLRSYTIYGTIGGILSIAISVSLLALTILSGGAVSFPVALLLGSLTGASVGYTKVMIDRVSDSAERANNIKEMEESASIITDAKEAITAMLDKCSPETFEHLNKLSLEKLRELSGAYFHLK